MDSKSDRRDGERHESRIKIRFATAEALQKEYATNISRGGLFVNTKKPHPLRSKVKFTLVLPITGEPVELTGEVVHSIPPKEGMDASKAGIGVQFLDLTADKRAKIESCIARIGQSENIPEDEPAIAEKREKKAEESNILNDAIRIAAKEVQELSAEQVAELKKKVKLFYAKRADRNHYDLLGVTYTASPEAIRTAYHKLSMDFHPDRHHKRLPPELRPQIEDIFGRINRAYKALKDNDLRIEYDISVGNWGTVPGVPELSEEEKRSYAKRKQYQKMFPEKVERAEEILHECESLLATGDTHNASIKLKLAFSFDPFNPKIISALSKLGVTVKPPSESHP